MANTKICMDDGFNAELVETAMLDGMMSEAIPHAYSQNVLPLPEYPNTVLSVLAPMVHVKLGKKNII